MRGFCPLASGSKGNSIFVGTAKTRILIDAGISATGLEKKLQEIAVALDTIQAILITHEHADHIKGIAQLVHKYQIPLLTNADTAKAITETIRVRPRFKIFTTGEPFFFGDLEIHPFTISHDAVDPVAFTVKMDNIKLGFCTDLGYATSLVRKRLEGSHYLYLEANHEPSMVHSCARPDIYKRRVLSRQGHLSNEECAQLLLSLWHSELQHVHLAHLSSECNSEELALRRMTETLLAQGKHLPISIAYQDRVSRRIEFQ
jgi:phosphoribosyl 1,2-cyclic phosphodiesterase